VALRVLKPMVRNRSTSRGSRKSSAARKSASEPIAGSIEPIDPEAGKRTVVRTLTPDEAADIGPSLQAYQRAQAELGQRAAEIGRLLRLVEPRFRTDPALKFDPQTGTFYTEGE
jgi:hypothetical protein